MLAFFFKTKIFESTGVSEIPVDEIVHEVVHFTCPCILRIIDNQIALGGMPEPPLHASIFFKLGVKLAPNFAKMLQ